MRRVLILLVIISLLCGCRKVNFNENVVITNKSDESVNVQDIYEDAMEETKNADEYEKDRSDVDIADNIENRELDEHDEEDAGTEKENEAIPYREDEFPIF